MYIEALCVESLMQSYLNISPLKLSVTFVLQTPSVYCIISSGIAVSFDVL